MMFKGVSYLLVSAACLALAGHLAFSQENFERGSEDEDRGAIGRYQLIEVEDSVLLLDTATGRIWNRARGGEWSYEGNPTREDESRERISRGRDLPEGSVRLIVHQREALEIGMLLIRLSDITDGQALLSVVASDDTVLLERTSVEQGDKVAFSTAGRRYEIYVEELRNLLTGNDFATLVISEGRSEESDEAEESVEPAEAAEEAEPVD